MIAGWAAATRPIVRPPLPPRPPFANATPLEIVQTRATARMAGINAFHEVFMGHFPFTKEVFF